eukprot:8992364-Pyramimonas_sp.AAC.1
MSNFSPAAARNSASRAGAVGTSNLCPGRCALQRAPLSNCGSRRVPADATWLSMGIAQPTLVA